MKKLEFLRRQKGLTQKQVAEDLGFSEIYYSQCESGIKKMSIPLAEKLAGYYKVPMRQIYFDSEITDETKPYKIIPKAFFIEVIQSPIKNVKLAWEYLNFLNEQDKRGGADYE